MILTEKETNAIEDLKNTGTGMHREVYQIQQSGKGSGA